MACTVDLAAESRDARTVVYRCRGAIPWRPVVLHSRGRLARVALVQTGACLLDGDRVAISIKVGSGAALELVELGATVVYRRGSGPGAELTITADVDADGLLLWAAAPLVVSAGARFARATSITLAAGARALVRETVVLGRHREPLGAAQLRTRVELDGQPLLHELLDTTDPEPVSSPFVFGRGRILDTTALLGARDRAAPFMTLPLAGPGALARTCASDASTASQVPELAWERWKRSLLDFAEGRSRAHSLQLF